MVTIVTGLAVLVLAVVVSIGGFLIVDRLVPFKVRQNHNDVAGFIYAFVGPLYAILLAFVVFTVWGYFDNARSAAAVEATEVYKIFTIAQGMAPDFRAQIRRTTLTYANSVINDEWPAMEHGQKRSATTREKYTEIREVIEAYVPADARETNLQAEELTNLDDLAGARNERLLKADDELNPGLWVALLAGAVLSIGYSYVFGIENRASHAFMIGVLAVSICGILYLIYVINAPYTGDLRVTPTAMQETVSTIEDPVTSAP